MIKLYCYPRTRSLRALWMLEETGLAYERAVIDIRNGEQDTDAFRAINPMGKVPALADGETLMAESGAICAYLADKVPEKGLAPAQGDPLRGRYLQWLFFAAGCNEPAIAQRFLNFPTEPRSIGWGGADKVFTVLDQALSTGPWILGENFSAADVMIGSDLIFAVERFKVQTPTPAFTAYLERCHARPSLQRAIAVDAGEG